MRRALATSTHRVVGCRLARRKVFTRENSVGRVSGQDAESWRSFRPMPPSSRHFLLVTFAGWVNRRQQGVVAFLLEENRILREQLDKRLNGRRLRFTDDQRRRLAAKGKLLGRKLLQEYAGLVTPGSPASPANRAKRG